MPTRQEPHSDPVIEATREARRQYNREREMARRLGGKDAMHAHLEAQAARRASRNIFCPICGTIFAKRRATHRYCSKNCAQTETSKNLTRSSVPPVLLGAANPSWRGGRRIDRGYVILSVPSDTPGRNKRHNTMLEHRYVMQKHLGRPLASAEHVHHRNGITDDNRIENLEVMSKSEHSALHAKQNPIGARAGKLKVWQLAELPAAEDDGHLPPGMTDAIPF